MASISRAPTYTIETAPREAWKGELVPELAKYSVDASTVLA
jgi:hypothetical protein